MPRPRRPLVVELIAVAALGILAIIRLGSPAKDPAPAEVTPLTEPAGPGETVTTTRAPEEIFRRAFWRHPAATDRIVHADRRDWMDTASGAVRRWAWFIEVQPGPELLAALRDPATFDLVAVTAPAPAASDAPPVPDWFPSTGQLAGCEIRQTLGGGLTVIYRAADHTLFATDTGRGFAPPSVPLASR